MSRDDLNLLLLQDEWERQEHELRSKISAFQGQLSVVPRRASLAAERESLLADIEELNASLTSIADALKATSATSAEVSNAWDIYRSLLFKVGRLGTRVDSFHASVVSSLTMPAAPPVMKRSGTGGFAGASRRNTVATGAREPT